MSVNVFIKNMVCNRCVMVVTDIFTAEGLPPVAVQLGQVTLEKPPQPGQLNNIEKKLAAVGFEILTDQKKKIVEKIRTTITDALSGDLSSMNVNFSQLISSALHKEYSYLSKLFSEVEGITIEKFIIDQKIDKVKEMLTYDEKSVNEIAFDMGYSSVAHLSSQFRKVTGFSPSEFKKLKVKSEK